MQRNLLQTVFEVCLEKLPAWHQFPQAHVHPASDDTTYFLHYHDRGLLGAVPGCYEDRPESGCQASALEAEPCTQLHGTLSQIMYCDHTVQVRQSTTRHGAGSFKPLIHLKILLPSSQTRTHRHCLRLTSADPTKRKLSRRHDQQCVLTAMEFCP